MRNNPFSKAMTSLRWRRVQIAVVPVVVLWFGLVGCKDPSDSVNFNARKQDLKTTTSLPPANQVIPDGPIVYVALGDSTGSGVGAVEGGYVARLFKRIEARRPGSKLVNLCFSGATTSDVLREQIDDGVRAAPQLVTLGIGINDIGHGVSVEQFAKNYEEILAKIRSQTKATIIVTNIPDISSAPRIPAAMRDQYQQEIIQFNRSLTEIAVAHGAGLFDVYAITHEQLPGHPEYFSGDGFHPSDKGYELWAERMWPTIAAVLGEKTEPASLQ